MIIERIPFQINFPLRILKSKKVNFKNEKEREKIFRRHIYYYKYEKVKNIFLEERSKIFLSLAREVIEFLKSKNPNLKILNISIFGSALYSKNPDDFDFLVIVEGGFFSYQKIKLSITNKERKFKYDVGISIKGINNFSRGVFNTRSEISLNFQSQVIYRTAISLFRRHIPLIGFDFVNNKKIFLKNAYAQVSDLLGNAYELYYLKNKKLSNKDRARKILSRTYEAISYMGFLEEDSKRGILRKNIAYQIEKGTTLQESKKIFDDVVLFYKKKTQQKDKKSKQKKKVLGILSNDKLKRNIKERLVNYWKCAKLPCRWIDSILEILSKFNYNEELALRKVRKMFPLIVKREGLYYEKLRNFRKVKVKNLAKRLKKDIFGKIIADVGGRTDDFGEQLLLSKKSIRKVYVTDLCSFTTRSKNPKINFVVQSSLTNTPFTGESIDTIILSMVLHHLNNKDQKELIKNLIQSLTKKGKIILIEDTYPEKSNLEKCDKTIKTFLGFKTIEKKRILYFYDWFGNKLMRNRDNISLESNYKTMEEWKEIFEKLGMEEIKSEFVKVNRFKPDIFLPKAIMVFQKK